MKCKKCNEELDKKSKFCKKCGEKVNNGLSKKQIILIIVGVIIASLFMLSGAIIDLILDSTITEYDYEYLELELKTVAISYEHSYIIHEEDDYKYDVSLDYSKDNHIMVSDLKSFLEKENIDNYIIDKKSKKLLNTCDGYVKITENKEFNGNSEYSSYLKCGSEYKTKGYDKKINKTVLNVNKTKMFTSPEFTGEYYIVKDANNKITLKQKYDSFQYNIGEKIDEAEIIGIYNCDGSYCSMANDTDTDHDTIAIYDNEKLVIYNLKTNEKIKTDVKYSSHSCEIKKVYNGSELIGIIVNYLYDEESYYYSIKDNKITIKLGKNESLNTKKLISSEGFVKLGYLIKYNLVSNTKKESDSKVHIESKEFYSLINIETGKEIASTKISNGKYMDYNGVPVIYENGEYNLINDSLKPTFKNKYMRFYNVDNKFYAYSYKGYGVYDKNTKTIKEKTKNVKSQYGKYFITYENNVVSIYNADNGTVIKQINFNAPTNVQLETEILVNKENVNIEGINYNGTYLFLMKEYMKCDVYKINETNDVVDLVNQNISYCGF